MKLIIPWKSRSEADSRHHWWRWRGKRGATEAQKRIVFPHEEDLDHLGDLHKSHR